MKFETLIDELEQNGRIFVTLAGGISNEEARIKPDEKSRSILEVVCHMLDEEREDFRPHLDLFLHHPQDPWPTIQPDEWVTSRHYEQDLASTLRHFQGERQKSIDWLRGLGKPDWEATYVTPWRTMKTGDMLAAWEEHDVLHLRQMVELRHEHVLRITTPYDVAYAGDW